jgi:hypothetical protein
MHYEDVYKDTGFQSAGLRREGLRQGAEWVYFGGVYIQLEDRLRVQVFNSLASAEIDVTARLLRPDGQIIPIRQQFFPTSNRAVNNFELDLAEGFLLDVALTTPTAGVKCGQLFATAQIIRNTGANAIVDHVLVADNIVTGQGAAWPQGTIWQSVENVGVIRSITGTTPAAGADIVETVPTGARWSLMSIRTQLVTSATAATRAPLFFVDDGVNAYFEDASQLGQAASQTRAWVWSSLPYTQEPGGATVVNQGIPSPTLMAAGHRFRTSTGQIQAGDQWSAPQYVVMEWLEP